MIAASGRTLVAPGIELAWRCDDYTDGWTEPETIMLLHGISEDGDAFRSWVPSLSRHYRVLRPDLRGFGGSSPLPEGQPLTLAAMADDLDALVRALGLKRVHIVGTKLGAQVAFVLAPRQPAWLASLSFAGVLISPGGTLARWVEEWIELVDHGGVEAWARATMPGRMGTALSPEAMAWWAREMGRQPAQTVKACFRMLPSLGEPPDLERITCPVQVLVAIAPRVSADFDQRQSPTDMARWQQRIPQSKLVEIEADSYHIAATHPEQCAALVQAFIEEIRS